ncbi:MAG TPA: cupin domain-containing protein [Gemmatimonadales bacterium]|nr:cupin domain-containing protein [Gemmatimonadales bacterium]
MSIEERLRPPPAARSRGPELPIDLSATARALREEAHPAKDGHRQIGLLHREHLRVVLFAFDGGGWLREHRAPGLVTIHALTGRLRVVTSSTTHELAAGQVLVLERDVPHDVEALDQADMLLTVHLDGERSGVP